MRVLFVYSLDDTQSVSKPLWSWSCIQFGISYISSVLQTEGHVTRLVVLGSNNEYQKSIKITNTIMSEFTPQVVCFTAVASQYQFINKIASAIKSRWPEAFMVIGGVHATLNPADVMNDSFDAVCIGEGEYPTLELCRQLEAGITPHGIANLWIRSPEGEIEKNPTRPFINDIDDLPFPDRAMWAPWVKEQRGAELSVLLGRGCPYNCTYCCNHALKQSASGKYVRFRSPENIIQEISFLHKAFPTQTRIFFQVESIALNKAWLLNL